MLEANKPVPKEDGHRTSHWSPQIALQAQQKLAQGKSGGQDQPPGGRSRLELQEMDEWKATISHFPESFEAYQSLLWTIADSESEKSLDRVGGEILLESGVK